MNKVLVIVESPTKAKTINKYLSNGYIVKSSFGHIRDLPINSLTSKKNISSTAFIKESVELKKKDKRSYLVNRMGINPWHNWEAQYEIVPGKEKIVAELKQLAEKSDYIYLATDLDREGEAIAWHLREVIGGDYKRYHRIVFNEITQNAIRQAFERPRELNIDYINAQQARRFMDRIIGYMISPLLWKKISRGLSTGRVQSVAVRLVVEREREIKSFVSEEYWEIEANIATLNGNSLPFRVTNHYGKTFRPKNYRQVTTAVELLSAAHYKVLRREDKLTYIRPSAPFTTSTLQQAACIYLGFSVKKTMMIAQRLYESGYITYMRTDSTNLSEDAINTVRNYINNNFDKEYLPKNANRYASRENYQKAHEAIRPSNISLSAELLKNMENDIKKLYQLIWCRFIACQMTPAKYNFSTLTIVAGDFHLKADSRVLCFDGWKKVMEVIHKHKYAKDHNLPFINSDNELALIKLIPTQHFTKPPSRFSEASLVKELEKRNIGRPSTYSLIISAIQNRRYVRMENGCFYAEKIGEIVTDRLEKNFRDLINYNFTAQMENNLDQVANHEAEWKEVLDNFFGNFINQLNKAEKAPEDGGMQLNQIVLTSIDCQACGRKMGIRTSTAGVFLSCSSYRLPKKERCKTTIDLIPEKKINWSKYNDVEPCVIPRCKKCSAAMDSYFIDLKRKLHICGNNPTCNGYKIEEDEFCIKGYNNLIIECDKCSSKMLLKIGRFGKYMICSNKECKNTRKILYNGKVAPSKFSPIPLPELSCDKSNTHFVLINGVAGIFLAASTFPKSRETRPPLVEELYRFRNRLPNELHYLANAPQKSPDGNKTVVRFSQKDKKHYISAEKDGKTTGWSASFINNKWIETLR